MSQCWFLINDEFSRLLINCVNFAVPFLKEKIWVKVSGLFPAPAFPPAATSSCAILVGWIHGFVLWLWGRHVGIHCFGIHLFSYLDRFYERHWRSICQFLSCTLTEPLCVTVWVSLPTSLPLWSFAICLQRQGFYSKRAYYCLTLGKLQRMSVYLIIQPDTISFPDGPDTVLFH